MATGSECVEAEVHTRLYYRWDYTIPSFPIYSSELVEVKVQWEDKDGSLLMFDAFARNCDLLNHQLPAIAEIPFSYDNPFIIEVPYIFKLYPMP